MSRIEHLSLESTLGKTDGLDGIGAAASLSLSVPVSFAHDRTQPPHLVIWEQEEWGVGRWFVLRGAGFSVGLVHQMRESECAAAADRFIAAEAAVEAGYRKSIAALNQAIDSSRSSEAPEDANRFKSLVRHLRALSARKLPADGLLEELCIPVERLRMAEFTRKQRLNEFEDSFRSALENQSRVLRSVAANLSFQEAVIWQNRDAFQSAVKTVAQHSGSLPERNKKQRQHEELIAKYLQRYCVKNDTIGFFGPVAWGKIEDDGSFEAVPGPSLVNRRCTYLEGWTIDKVAHALSSLPGMKWWIAPRLMPYYRLQGRTLYSPTSSPVSLGALAAAVLSLCDGQLQTIKIVAAIKRMPFFRRIDKMEIHRLLTNFVEQGIVRWRLSVPLEANSEEFLRRELLRIEESSLRETTLKCLDQLEAARSEVAAAAGNVDSLDAALGNLDRVFESITGSESRRNPGAAYAARTIAYEDCRRDLILRAGIEVLAPVKSPLLLLLKSLRWYVKSTGAAFRRTFHDIYEASALSLGSRDVPAENFWLNIKSLLESPPAAITSIEELFKFKWERILPWEKGQSRVFFTSDQIKNAVHEAFPELQDNYHPVRYYCPDLMLAARDAGAIERGEALYVLGEMHLGKNTLYSVLFVEQHPERQELIDALKWDFPEGRFRLINSRYWPEITTRTNDSMFCPTDILLAASEDAAAPSGFSAHPISELVVRDRDGKLIVASRDGSLSFDALAAFADLLTTFVMHRSKWFAAARHIPRVTIDQLVIHRETWSIPVGELDFAFNKDQNKRFLAARMWAREQGMPAILFVKSPIEPKPFYVDLDSPVYVEILCKTVRRLLATHANEEVAFSEMLPTTDDAWLADNSGLKYTSELRLAIIDLKERASCKSQ